MRFLIVGLGSMGKRRVRNLQALQAGEIIGFDPREDRCAEARGKYGIEVHRELSPSLLAQTDAWIISTAPDLHMTYARMALKAEKHFFTEASVTDDGLAELASALRGQKIVGVPSCTMRFYPGPKKIKEWVMNRRIGRILGFTYHCGQYLPDWHPWEDYRNYYVSKRETGACREIVPFELVWLTWAFGQVEALSCMKGKVGDLAVEIDDLYQLLLKLPGGGIGHLMVDVLARPDVRHMRIIGTEGVIEWCPKENRIRASTLPDYSWETVELNRGTVEKQYVNPEEPYIEEMSRFLRAIRGQEDFSYSYEEDHHILQILYAAEESSRRMKHALIESRDFLPPRAKSAPQAKVSAI